MSDALARWIGWAAMLLLVLGAVGTFFSQYRSMAVGLESTRAVVLRDDLYVEGSSPNRATGDDSEAERVCAYNLQLSEVGVTGLCSGSYLQSLWLLSAATTARSSWIQVDGIALETLDVTTLRETDLYRMTSRKDGEGAVPGLCFELLP